MAMEIGPKTRAAMARDARLIGSALKIRYTPLTVAAGDGPYMIDVDGKRYLDFTSSWSLAHLGYSDERVRDAVTRQLERTSFASLISGINEPALDLAERLTGLMPGDFPKKVWFGLAGSDASEAAMRLVALATGKPRFVSFIGSWHGTTGMTMALSGHPALHVVARRRRDHQDSLSQSVSQSVRRRLRPRHRPMPRFPGEPSLSHDLPAGRSRGHLCRNDAGRLRRHRAAARFHAEIARPLRPPRLAAGGRRHQGRPRPHRHDASPTSMPASKPMWSFSASRSAAACR